MKKTNFDYSKLKGKIKEIYGTQSQFSKMIGLSTVSLSAKLNNDTDFRQEEIQKCAQSLGIKNDEIHSYFFCKIS